MMDQTRVGELASDAIEARIVGNRDRALEILQIILVDGTKRDALAFTLACVHALSKGLVLGGSYKLGALEIDTSGRVNVVNGYRSYPGVNLFGRILASYLVMDNTIPQLWADAEDSAVAMAVGIAVNTAAALFRQQRAFLN